MNKKYLIYLITLILFASFTYALPFGCCCNPDTSQAFQPSPIPEDQCTAKGFSIFPTDPNNPFDCTLACGGEIMEANITYIQRDCTNQEYQAPPPGFVALNERGRPYVELKWDLDPCGPDYYIIEKCDGLDCTNFKELIETKQRRYIDNEKLYWNSDYTYQIKAFYNDVNMNSNPATATINIGDIECAYRYEEDQFCINKNFYKKYENYLKTNGYDAGGASRDAVFFNDDFESNIDYLFGGRYGKAYTCDDLNRINEVLSCRADEVCVADYDYEEGRDMAQCILPIDCQKISDGHFGLEVDKNICEGIFPEKNYCFYDRSFSLIDYCFDCPRDGFMSCYDYKTQSACGSDNCGLGECQWNSIYPELGVGVCIDANANNCYLCDIAPNPFIQTPGSGNVDRSPYNYIYEKCSMPKASALSTPSSPCYFRDYEKDGEKIQDAVGCEYVTCNSYTERESCTQTDAIVLDGLNKIINPSENACDIQVCQWFLAQGTGKCSKNANGDEFRDCVPGDESCELDYFKPESDLIPTGKFGKINELNVHIFDKVGFLDPGRDRAGESGYQLKFCIDCFSQPFDLISNSKLLTLNDGILREGENEITILEEGKRTIKYFAVDKYKNKGIVKEIQFEVCTNCQGPRVVSSYIEGSTEKDGKYYTRNTNPLIEVFYDEPARIAISKLIKDGVDQILTQQSTGLTFYHSFQTQNLEEGEYTFVLTAEDENGIRDEPFNLNLVIDTSSAEAEITINDLNTELNPIIDTSTGKIKIDFKEFVNISKITIDKSIETKYGYLKKAEDVTSLFANDGIVYTGNILALTEGTRTLRIYGKDLSSNNIEQIATFRVNADSPKIAISSPSFGVSSNFSFNLIFETLNPAECKFWFLDMINKPTYSALNNFDSTNDYYHKLMNFNLIEEENINYPVYIECKDNVDRISSRFFNLSVDTTSLIIRNAFAEPEIIVQSPYSTFFKVATDDESFCKYDKDTSNFHQMSGKFPDFYAEGKKSHSVLVNVSDQSPQTYNVACINLAELSPAGSTVSFSIDLGRQLEITDTTLFGSSNTSMIISVSTNKKSLCSYGESEDYITMPFDGDRIPKNDHTAFIDNVQEGNHSRYIACTATGVGVSGQIERKTLKINFMIDLSPPEMIYVNDSSVLDNEQYSPYTNKVLVSWKAEDRQSDIGQFKFMIVKNNGDIALPWVITNRGRDNKPFYIDSNIAGKSLNLINREKYKIIAKAINKVGGISESLESNGFTVDTSKTPDSCRNLELDDDETDIDCGGPCGSTCEIGQACFENSDCNSYFCNNRICEESTCTDRILNGYETDVDCGGSICSQCDLGDSCSNGDDCKSGICIHGECSDFKQCNDGMISGDETDVDCGGSCPDKCLGGQSCKIDDDCNGKCINFICIDCDQDDFDCDGIENCLDDDIDNDGKKNWEDPDDDNDGLCDTKDSPLNQDCFGEDQDDNNNGVMDPGDKDCNNDLDNDGIENEFDDDMDGDGIKNIDDLDNDNDGIPDDEDPDDDNDGIPDGAEDKDGDGMPDNWEEIYGLNPQDSSDAMSDLDNDNLNNLKEYSYGTNPTLKDTDGDGWRDGKELDKRTDPLDPDSKPTSVFWSFVIYLIFILALGTAGYFTYDYFKREKKIEFRKKHKKPTISVKELKRRSLEEEKRAQEREKRISSLKKYIKPKDITKEEWMTLKDLERKVKKYPEAFDKLRDMIGKSSKKEVFEKLRNISNISKKELFKKLSGERKFSQEEINKIISNLRNKSPFTKLKNFASKKKKFSKLTKKERDNVFKKLGGKK